MPTIVELAELSAAVYENADFVSIQLIDSAQGWKRKQSWSFLGFHAAYYEPISGGLPVLAYRGTNDGWDIFVDDLAIAKQAPPPQAGLAIGLAQRMAGERGWVVLTGHSLGGALALYGAANTGLAAVTFNAPGMLLGCVQSGGWFSQTASRCMAGNRIRNIRVDGDVVSSFVTGPQSGPTKTYSSSCSATEILCKHGSKTCVQVVRGDPDNFKPIPFGSGGASGSW